MTSQRDHLKAGLFLFFGLVLALGCVFVLSDLGRLLEKTRGVRVSYRLSDGLHGLKVGAMVTLGHQPVGTVNAIEDLEITGGEGGGRVVGKIVTIEIPRRYKVYRNAVIELVIPPLGSGTRLNIRDVGDTEPYKVADTIEGRIAGSVLTKNLLRDAGIEDVQRQQIRGIIANLEAVTETLKQDLPKLNDAAYSVLDGVSPLIAEAREAVSHANAASENVRALVEKIKNRSDLWVDRLDSITGSADDSLVTVRNLLRDKDQVVRDTLDHTERVTREVKQRVLGQVSEALEKAAAALDSLKAATAETQVLIAGQRPVLERALANAQLTTDQLKLAAIEIRRSPWRLLYRPDEAELDSDNLYDSARSFAMAAGALESAAQSLRAVAVAGVPGEKVQPMLDHLEALFEKFELAESSFWQTLKGQNPAR